jgi:hypothetical protein
LTFDICGQVLGAAKRREGKEVREDFDLIAPDFKVPGQGLLGLIEQDCHLARVGVALIWDSPTTVKCLS